MKINQDTFKDGKLYFGDIENPRRLSLWKWRWHQFISSFETYFPEVIINLGSIDLRRSFIVADNVKELHYKYSVKLYYALDFDDMEKINTSEFDKIIKTFKNYLHHSTEADKLRTLHKAPQPFNERLR